MIDIKEALAKSIGIKLLNHNRNVSIASEFIARKILKIKDEELIRIIKLAALLHDIGKLTEMFQELLLNSKKSNKTNKFRHNEIAWAFLYKYLNLPTRIKKMVINNIYWHHGISNKLSAYTSDEILNSDVVTDDTIEAMNAIVVKLLDASYIKENINTAKTPAYYIIDQDDMYDDYNEIFAIVHTCVISADKTVSELETKMNNIDLNS
ncbi:MAG: CRISPR-associated endonuclease Cas3'' [bacterium]